MQHGLLFKGTQGADISKQASGREDNAVRSELGNELQKLACRSSPIAWVGNTKKLCNNSDAILDEQERNTIGPEWTARFCNDEKMGSNDSASAASASASTYLLSD